MINNTEITNTFLKSRRSHYNARIKEVCDIHDLPKAIVENLSKDLSWEKLFHAQKASRKETVIERFKNKQTSLLITGIDASFAAMQMASEGIKIFSVKISEYNLRFDSLSAIERRLLEDYKKQYEWFMGNYIRLMPTKVLVDTFAKFSEVKEGNTTSITIDDIAQFIINQQKEVEIEENLPDIIDR